MKRTAWALFLLAACNNPDPTCFSTPVTGPGQTLVPLSFVGQPETVSVPVPGRTTTCNGLQFPQSVQLEVLDPLDQPVEASVSPQPLAGDSAPVRFTFTPKTAGSYHLTARFEPDFGTVQIDALIASDLTGAATTSVAMPVPCARFDQQGEVAFCLDPGPSMINAVIDGGVVTRLPAHDFALAPQLGGIWVLAPVDATTDVVQFFLLDGGAMTMVGQAQVVDLEAEPCSGGCGNGQHTSITDGRVIARGDRALVILPPHLGFVGLDGGVHYDERVQSLGNANVQWPGGDAFEIAETSADQLIMFCTAGADGGACSTVAGVLAGATADAVWGWNDNTHTLQGVGVTSPGAQQRSFQLTLGQPPNVLGSYAPERPAAFVVDAGLMLLGSHDGAPSLALYPLPSTTDTYWGADSNRVWRWDASTDRVVWQPR